jgi:AraC-like DNA-binding protein/quercetin dioxygenase-like cupin family protein
MADQENTVVFRKDTETLKVSELLVRKKTDMKARHFHDTAELYILMEGKRYLFADRRVLSLKAGQAVLIPPGRIHKTSTFGDDPCYRRFLLHLSEKGSEGIIRSLTGMDFEAFCLKYQGCAAFDSQTWPRVLDLMDRIKSEFGGDSPDLPMARLLAHELLLVFAGQKDRQEEEGSLQGAAPASPGSSPGIHGFTEDVIAYLSEHYMEDISLDDLSGRFFVSRAYLTRSFRAVTGVTLVQYLTVVRIRNACRLLKDTDDSVTEIARACGFSGGTYFENVFKRLRGMTPRQYRKKAGLSDS